MKKLNILNLTLLGLATALLPSAEAMAGTLNSPANVTETESAMYSIEDIYDRLYVGTTESPPSLYSNPTSGPSSTGKTMNELMAVAPAADNAKGAVPGDVKSGKTYWGLRTDGSWGPEIGTGSFDASLYPAPVPKSGQTISYAAKDDGAQEKGASWPLPRFRENGNGTVTDLLTGLIWLQKANCMSTKTTWTAALTAAATLNSSECGLTDGSKEGDWRLPQVRELKSLADKGQLNPALPVGHPFAGVQADAYWSSTTVYTTDASPPNAWHVNFSHAYVKNDPKSSTHYVWPVKGGQ